MRYEQPPEEPRNDNKANTNSSATETSIVRAFDAEMLVDSNKQELIELLESFRNRQKELVSKLDAYRLECCRALPISPQRIFELDKVCDQFFMARKLISIKFFGTYTFFTTLSEPDYASTLSRNSTLNEAEVEQLQVRLESHFGRASAFVDNVTSGVPLEKAYLAGFGIEGVINNSMRL